jgi:quercetin dioxygenase-like cupin family protein
VAGSRDSGLGTRDSKRVVTPGFERNDARGVFREVLSGFEARTFIWGEMKKGAVLGNHYHKRTRVFFYLTRGKARVAIVNVETGKKEALDLRANEGIFFEVNESHAVRFTEEGEFVMLKSLTYDAGDPDTFSHPIRDDP